MKPFDTLIFPDTRLIGRHHLPLLLLFDTLHLIEVLESEKESSQPLDSFMEKGFCQVHTPVPLEEDRDRFHRLIHDLRERKDSYAAQLSSLTLASMSEQSVFGDSKQEIASAILGDGQQPDSGEDFWQARLILAIGELLDEEEEELTEHLAAIDQHEIEMFSRLRGELDNDEDADRMIEDIRTLQEKINGPRPAMSKNRFNSWLKFSRETNLAEEFFIWTSHREEAWDLLQARHEKVTGHSPLTLLRLRLPARFNASVEQAVQQVDAIAKDLAQLREKISGGLQELVCSGEILIHEADHLLPQRLDWQRRFNDEIDYHFPQEQHGRNSLNINLLPNINLADLYGQKDDSTRSTFNHGLVALSELLP